MACFFGREERLKGVTQGFFRDEPSGHGAIGTAIRENRTVVIPVDQLAEAVTEALARRHE